MATEYEQGVHPFTIAWWYRLPSCYRAADRVQGYPTQKAWDGLNRDPRFFTGWDSWYRVNISTRPWVAAVAFTRTFRATPRVPLHIRSWHRPVIEDAAGERTPIPMDNIQVRHVVRNYTGDVIADHTPAAGGPGFGQEIIYDGGGVTVGDEDVANGGTPGEAPGEVEEPAVVDPNGRLDFHTVVTPDRFGVVHVTIQVHVSVPHAHDLMDAVHVGHTDTTWDGLPTLDDYTAARPYPLLRFLDGMGHQFGFLSDAANDMHEGWWTDPEWAPENTLGFLAAVMGVSTRYARSLTGPQLRQHLMDMVDQRAPTPGSRTHIAATARQWLSGTRDVSVSPAHATPGWSGADPLHTLIVTARADEMPQGKTLEQFADFLNASGVIPAGHRVVVREAKNTWDQFASVAGSTWASTEAAIPTWNAADSAGVTLSEGA